MAISTGQNNKCAVLGLGQTGFSCARYLSAQGYEVVVMDTRQQPPMLNALKEALPDVAVFLGEFSTEIIRSAGMVLVSPGISIKNRAILAAQSGLQDVIGDIELFAQVVSEPVIAITGSNGKSTVTTLVSLMCQESGRIMPAGGNLGTPALDLISNEAEGYVLELSSFQLETTKTLDAEVAVILNVSADHMDRYEDMADYLSAKARILQGSGIAILNRDDQQVSSLADHPSAGRRTVRTFGLGTPNIGDAGLQEYEGQEWLAIGEQRVMPVSDLKIVGRHNVLNALAALLVARALALPESAVIQVLKTFPGLPHRCEWVAECQGVTYINDSKGTNVGASIAAIEGFDRPLVWLGGGEGKGADFGPLAKVLERRARVAIVMGRAAASLAHVLAPVVETRQVQDMKAMVACAQNLAQPGDQVLLSPACASLDMYENYEARGQAFVDAVNKMMGEVCNEHNRH